VKKKRRGKKKKKKKKRFPTDLHYRGFAPPRLLQGGKGEEGEGREKKGGERTPHATA